MREIEFRAWDERNKRYCKNPIAVSNDGVLEMIGDVWVDTSFIAEQYAGLKDKNGAKIFAGDILEFEDVGEEGYEYIEGFDFTNRALMTFYNGRFELDKFYSCNSSVLEEMNGCHDDFVLSLQNSKVIGNIHDNPELLKLD